MEGGKKEEEEEEEIVLDSTHANILSLRNISIDSLPSLRIQLLRYNP